MDENLEFEQDIEEDIDETEIDDIEDTEDEVTDAEDYDEGEDADDDESSDDEELEYDEDGNVIVAEDGETDAEEQSEDTAESTEKETESETTDNRNDSAYDALKKQHDDRESLIRDVLKSVGIDDDDVEKGLARLAADAEGLSVDEYIRKRLETKQADEAQKFYQKMMVEQMIAKDMNELHSLFPETKGISRLEDVPNCKRYAELRDMGLSVREAYNAANPDARRDTIVNSTKQKAINASKSHLKSNVPVAARDTSVKITRGEMEQMRELFPEMSDKQLVALYKKTI